MSSPAICVHTGKNWSLSQCNFYVLTTKKKHTTKTKNIYIDLHKPFSSQEERFDNISSWALSVIPKNSLVFLEGYAFAAKGVVFDIGENCGLLKHKLHFNKIQFDVFSPPTIKKFATGKGNANKLTMYHSFVNETQWDISAIIDCHEGESPMSDIIDAYYVCKFGYVKNSLG